MKKFYSLLLIAVLATIVFISCNKPTTPVESTTNKITQHEPIDALYLGNITFVDKQGNIIDTGVLDRFDLDGVNTLSSLFLACLENSKNDNNDNDNGKDYDNHKDNNNHNDKDRDNDRDNKKDDKKDKNKNKRQCGDGSDNGDDYENHGAYVSCMAHVTQDLVKNGVLSAEERALIMAAAAQSAVGK